MVQECTECSPKLIHTGAVFPTVDSHHKWNWQNQKWNQQRIPGESPVERGFPQHKPCDTLFFSIQVNGIKSGGVAKKKNS